ncbi:MAG: glycosyltransferase family 9 protein [bacterium]
MQKIVIFRNGSIGNTLVAIPVMRAVKEKLKSHVTVIVDSVGYELLSNTPYIDNLIIYEKKGKDRGLFNHIRFIHALKKDNYDIAILLKRFFRNELIAYLAGIKERIGFKSENATPFKLTKHIPYDEGKNIIDLNLSLLNLINIKPDDDRLEIFPSDQERKIAATFLHENTLIEKDYFIAHFGGNTLKDAKWPSEKYGRLCEKIIETHKNRIILISGPGEIEFNKRIALAVAAQYRPYIKIAHNLPLKSFVCLIDTSILFLGNDSGPSHLADVAGKKSLIFFSHKEDIVGQIKKWKPKGEKFIPLYSKDGNINNVTVDQAFEKFTFLLDNY